MGNIFKKSRGKTGVQKDFKEEYNFLFQRTDNLDEYLKELDDSKKVECDSLFNQNIARQAESYVKQILDKVEQQETRFKSTFLCSGSFYDEVKIELPDEFDCMAKLELLSRPGILKAVATKLGFVQLVMEDPEAIKLWNEFLVDDTNNDEKVIHNVVSIMMLSKRFEELVQLAMKSVPNPPQWRRYPCALQHGPCAMLTFVVDGFQDRDPLYISIDLAICITYPKYQSIQFPFYKYLKEKNVCMSFLEKLLSANAEVLLVPFTHDNILKSPGASSVWEHVYREQMRVSFSMWEQAIFSQFAKDSIEKRLLRVLKILRDAHLRDDGSIEEWENPELDEFPDEPPSTTLQVSSVQQITPSTGETESEQSTSLEEGEAYIHQDEMHKDLLQTYVFKSLFFYAKLHNDHWFSGEKLSEALLECLEALFEIYSTPGSTVPNFFFDGYTGQIPSERNRAKIQKRLVKILAHLRLQIALR